MKDLKLRVIGLGIFGITIISIISLLIFGANRYGLLIVYLDISLIVTWIILSNYIVNIYLKNKK